MIHIKREKAATDFKVYQEKTVVALDGATPVSEAERELEEAVAFYNNPSNFAGEKKLTKENFKFEIYKNKELSDALKAMFGTKCAYCEIDFGGATDKEVEHFRPKGEVHFKTEAKTNKLIPGYFWLAGEWENLLSSCQHCNQRRQTELPGKLALETRGKGNQFPLRDEAKRIRYGGNVAEEEAARLLLNPYVDDPEIHLTFDKDGLIYPRKDAGGMPSDMGEKSIEVYNLLRKELVEKRLGVLNSFIQRVEDLNAWIEQLNTAHKSGAPDAAILAQIARNRNILAGMLAPNQQFLGMLRSWIRDGTEQGHYDQLIQAGIDLRTLI